METDIRNTKVGMVDTIRFGDNAHDIVEKRPHSGNIRVASDDMGLVMIEDIDNLILALQKAKELWGK